MLVLVGKGLLREEAYRLVQGHAMTSWTQGLDFRELIMKDEEIMRHLSPHDIEKAFSYDIYKDKVDYIFKRCGLD